MKSLWRSPFLTFALLAVDTAALWLLWLGAHDIRQSLNPLFPLLINPPEVYYKALPLLLPVWLLILARYRFYTHHERISSLNAMGPILWAVCWMVVAAATYNLIFKPNFGRSVMGFFAVLAVLYLFLSRSSFRFIKRRAVENGHGRVRVLVVGGQELGHETMMRIREHPDIGFRLVGFIKAHEEDDREEIYGYPALGHLPDLERVVRRHRIEEIFFASEHLESDETFTLIAEIQSRLPVVCKVVANMLYVIANQAKVDEIIGLPVIAFRGRRLYPLEKLGKRAMDLILCAALGIFLAPLGLLFAFIIRRESPGSVLFVHERVGKNGRPFKMLKFRTMYAETNPYAEAPQDQKDPRVTPFGRFLRRTSLDEIPQLLNVLKGEMSIVGPRPEMLFIVERYAGWERVRLAVQPGVTGLWQVAGRKNLPLHLNLEYDFYYVKNHSLALDAEILIRTIPAVLRGKGAY